MKATRLQGHDNRRDLCPLTPATVTVFPAAMLAYHLLLAHWFTTIGQLEAIELEVQALDWINHHFDAIASATAVDHL